MSKFNEIGWYSENGVKQTAPLIDFENMIKTQGN